MTTAYEINAKIKNGMIKIPSRYLKYPYKKVKVVLYPSFPSNEKDDALMSEEEYFAMLDKRLAEYERNGEVIEYTPELEEKWFGNL